MNPLSSFEDQDVAMLDVFAARRRDTLDSPSLVRDLDKIADGEDGVGEPELTSALAEEEHFVKSHRAMPKLGVGR